MESTLYEFGFHIHWNDCLKILAFIFPILIWFFSETLDNIKWIRIALKLSSICITIFLVWSLYIYPIVEYYKIRNDIAAGNVYVVEGEVSNFDTPTTSLWGHVTESFSINEIEFSYSGTENYGYNKLRCNGGVIEGNGQKLKITYYIPAHTYIKIICKIESVP